jgi:hypothetical protein
MRNAEYGYVPADASIMTLAGTNVGFLSGDIELRTPREYARLELDQVIVALAAVQTRKSMTITAIAEEVLQDNMRYAMDNDAWQTEVLTVDDDVGATVALILNANAPDSGSRAISVPKALGVGDAAMNMRFGAAQQIALEFEAIGDPATNGLLGTITDS